MRSLFCALAISALPMAALAEPATPIDPTGNFSVVNGIPTTTDEWASFVALEVDQNKSVLQSLINKGVTDTDRFINDIKYAREIITGSPNKPEPDVEKDIRELQAQAQKALKNELPMKHHCGGTLIANNWVLTAAHCVHSDEVPKESLKIRQPKGTHRAEAFLDVADIHTHPRYESTVSLNDSSLGESTSVNAPTPEKINPLSWDVALVRLVKPVPNAQLMKLAGVADSLPRTGTGLVAGLGGVKWNQKIGDYESDPTRTLRQAEVPFNEISTCNQTDSMLCAEKPEPDPKKGNPASCYGDSGGPLVIQAPDKTKIQHGIVSHTIPVPWLDKLKGDDCGHAPAHYTSVSLVQPWIQATMGNRIVHADGIKDAGIDANAKKIVLPIPNGSYDPTELGIHLSRVRSAVRPEKARHIGGVVLANKNYPADALASGVLQNDQIMMLTEGKDLDQKTLAELQRLQPKQVTLLGGSKVMSTLVEARLRSAGFAVNRIAGETRLETAVAIAKSRVYSDPSVIHTFVSRAFGQAGVPGSETADALSLGATSARELAPILLSPTAGLPTPILNWMKYNSGYTQGVIVGGPQAVSTSVEAALRDEGGITIQRIAGADRVQTAAALASRVKDPSRVIVVDAKNPESWKAAFQVAGLAADLKAPVVLADGNSLPEVTKTYLSKVKAAKEGPALVCVAQAGACTEAAKALGL